MKKIHKILFLAFERVVRPFVQSNSNLHQKMTNLMYGSSNIHKNCHYLLLKSINFKKNKLHFPPILCKIVTVQQQCHLLKE